mgnify:FL=1
MKKNYGSRGVKGIKSLSEEIKGYRANSGG